MIAGHRGAGRSGGGRQMAVSYVVPVYNKAAFLPQVLQALAAERDETGGEIILVDDGSTDASPRLLSDFAAAGTNARLFTQPNAGVAAATNRGFALAQCEYVRLVDADDTVVAGSTRRLRRAMAEEGVEFAFGHHHQYAGSLDAGLADRLAAELAGARARRLTDPLMRFLVADHFIPSVTLGRRAAMAACFPLPLGYRTSQDFILGIRLAATTSLARLEAACCHFPLAVPGRLSASRAQMFWDAARMIADEWEGPNAALWSPRHRRVAARRIAGRAILYARRHLRVTPGHAAWLRLRKAMTHLPHLTPTATLLRRIAATYDQALADRDRYP